MCILHSTWILVLGYRINIYSTSTLGTISIHCTHIHGYSILRWYSKWEMEMGNCDRSVELKAQTLNPPPQIGKNLRASFVCLCFPFLTLTFTLFPPSRGSGFLLSFLLPLVNHHHQHQLDPQGVARIARTFDCHRSCAQPPHPTYLIDPGNSDFKTIAKTC